MRQTFVPRSLTVAMKRPSREMTALLIRLRVFDNPQPSPVGQAIARDRTVEAGDDVDVSRRGHIAAQRGYRSRIEGTYLAHIGKRDGGQHGVSELTLALGAAANRVQQGNRFVDRVESGKPLSDLMAAVASRGLTQVRIPQTHLGRFLGESLVGELATEQGRIPERHGRDARQQHGHGAKSSGQERIATAPPPCPLGNVRRDAPESACPRDSGSDPLAIPRPTHNGDPVRSANTCRRSSPGHAGFAAQIDEWKPARWRGAVADVSTGVSPRNGGWPVSSS